MAWLLLGVYVLNVLTVAAQLPFPVLEDHLLCNTTIDHANASGVVSQTIILILSPQERLANDVP